jgi:alpha-tubulin suppressor-like RCC1 family protein
MSTCALTRSGMVTCWGSNMYGQLGNAGQMTQPGPVEVQFP